MGIYHIAYGDQGKLVVPGLTGLRVDAEWTGSAIAGAQYIGANNIVLFGVNYTAGAYHALPPIGGIAIGSKGMTYPNHVVFSGIQRAVSMVSDGQIGQLLPAFELKWLIIMKILH